MSSCQPTNKHKTRNNTDIILASVADRKMYLSDIEDMIYAENLADSINQVNAFVESWLKRNVVLNEATEKFPQDIDIDKLVEDYRSSLLLHDYRQKLIENKLDSTVSKQQELEYYNKNKDQYLLAEPICRGLIAEIPDHAPRIEQFYKKWKKNDDAAISKYLDKHATYRMEDSNTWIATNQFILYLPKGVFNVARFNKKRDLQKHNKNSEYFIKILEVIGKNEIPPLSYIKESIRKVIIHNRKKEILKNIEQDLYNSYLKANKIRVYEYGK